MEFTIKRAEFISSGKANRTINAGEVLALTLQDEDGLTKDKPFFMSRRFVDQKLKGLGIEEVISNAPDYLLIDLFHNATLSAEIKEKVAGETINIDKAGIPFWDDKEGRIIVSDEDMVGETKVVANDGLWADLSHEFGLNFDRSVKREVVADCLAFVSVKAEKQLSKVGG